MSIVIDDNVVTAGFPLLYLHCTIFSCRLLGSLVITAGRNTFVISSIHTGSSSLVIFGEHCCRRHGIWKIAFIVPKLEHMLNDLYVL